jgi:peptidoglycan/xylan/chitin deacetylase (PgdA/CDA1 family)
MLKKITAAFLAVLILTSATHAQSVELPILMYHFLIENRGEHHISPQEFEKDLIFLKENGYNTIGISDLVGFVYQSKPLPPNPVMLTFDDGYYNNYRFGFPLLMKYQSKAVINIIGDHTDIWSNNFYEDLQHGHVTWENIREMLSSGLVEIGNHTYSMHKAENSASNKHGRRGCTRIDGENLMDFQRLFGRDVQRLQERILVETGYTADAFAFPYHEVCEDAVQVLRILGFRVVFTGAGKSNTVTAGDAESLLNLRRVNRSRFRCAESILTTI